MTPYSVVGYYQLFGGSAVAFFISALKMMAVYFFETILITYDITDCRDLGDHSLNRDIVKITALTLCIWYCWKEKLPYEKCRVLKLRNKLIHVDSDAGTLSSSSSIMNVSESLTARYALDTARNVGYISMTRIAQVACKQTTSFR